MLVICGVIARPVDKGGGKVGFIPGPNFLRGLKKKDRD